MNFSSIIDNRPPSIPCSENKSNLPVSILFFIELFLLPLTSYLNNAVPGDGSHWRVETWERNTTTEGGSSGSALFDANHRVIGQLHGGYAACGNTTSDWYGMFSVSWDGASSAERLRDWLDPANTTTTIDGYDPNAPTVANDAQIQSVTDPSGVICGTTTAPVVTLKNIGSSTLTSVTITYNIDGGTNSTFAWTGSLTTGQSEDVTLTAIAITAGAHTLNASVLNPNGVADENTANDGSSSAYTAFTDGVTVDLELNTDCWGSETDWVIADGGTDLYSGSGYGDVTGGETFSESFCLDPGCYDFEINDTYGDGMFGSQYGSCDVNGSYYITVAGRHVDSIQAADSDYGNQEVNNFCIKSIYSDFSSDIQSVCENATVSFTASPLIGTATSYTWVFEGGTASSLTTSNPTVTYAAAGTYDVTLTVGDGSDSDTYTLTDYITVLDAPNVAEGTVVQVTCNAGNNGSINPVVSGGDGNYTYSWNNGAGTNVNASGLTANDYTLSVTDGNTCSGTVIVTISEPTAIVVDVTTVDASCGSNNGSATANASGGDGSYTYVWSSGGTSMTENNLPGGAISVTVTDGNTCTADGASSVSTSGGPTVTLASVTNTSCNGGSDGAIAVDVSGGAGGNTYSWNNGAGTSEDATGLSANTYTLTVTDANDCVSSLTQEVTEPAVLTATIVTSDASCGVSDGSATVTPTGGTAGYTYSWSTGGTNATENGVPSGAISVIVTDSKFCTFTANDVVNSPNAPVVSLNSVTNVDCFGAFTGSIDIDVTGGSGSNTYSWTNGAGTNEDAISLGAGSYTVTVTDIANCTAVLTQEITEGSQMVVTADITNVTGVNDGAIDLTVSGGDGSFSFAWGNGLPATEDQSGLAAGTYTVTITDGNGCPIDTSFTLNDLGINETTTIESSIYPNPTNGWLNVELNESNVTLNVVNAFGQIVMNTKTTGKVTQLDLSGFTKGIYMVQMTNESGHKSIKKVVLLD